MIVDPVNPHPSIARSQPPACALSCVFRLSQRSSVILMDVLGYSLEEIGGVHGQQRRRRSRLRCIVAARACARWRRSPRSPLPGLAEPERSLLAAYVERFNARDFDAIRDMLADEVRLELVSATRMNGRNEVRKYFQNYSPGR